MTSKHANRPHRISHRHGASVRPARERGAVLPLVALSLVTVLVVATLVVDGSQAYPTRRKAQNAADAAAAVGAQQLDKAKWYTDAINQPAAAQAVYTKALDTARANAGSNTTITCTLIDGNGNTISACPETATVGYTVPAAVQGVRVVASVPRKNTFGTIAAAQPDARASAAATVQKLASVGSPFIICANTVYGTNKLEAYDILKTDAFGPRPDGPDADNLPDGYIYNSDGSVDVDPAKVWQYQYDNPSKKKMILQGDNGKGPANCNGGAENTGKGIGDTTNIPGWVSYQQGNGNEASIAEQVLSATACPSPLPPAGTELDCDILLPIAIEGSSANRELFVVGLGQFHVMGDGRGSPKYYGYFVAAGAYVAGGKTTIDPVTAASLRVIRLIE